MKSYRHDVALMSAYQTWEPQLLFLIIPYALIAVFFVRKFVCPSVFQQGHRNIMAGMVIDKPHFS